MRFQLPVLVHFSTLNWELLPWSTLPLSSLAIEVNWELYLMDILARRVFRECCWRQPPFIQRNITAVARAFDGLSTQRILPHGYPTSTGISWVLLEVAAGYAAKYYCCGKGLRWLEFSDQKTASMTCSVVDTSGIVRGNLWHTTPQIWLVQIGRLPHGLVLSKGRCLVQS